MNTIQFKGQTIKCQQGENLRKVLRKAKLSPHNGDAKWLNCKGFGTCGTCALEIKGKVSPITKVEKLRLNFPPHQLKNGLRLACQCAALGDLELVKHKGFWGEKV